MGHLFELFLSIPCGPITWAPFRCVKGFVISSVKYKLFKLIIFKIIIIIFKLISSNLGDSHPLGKCYIRFSVELATTNL